MALSDSIARDYMNNIKQISTAFAPTDPNVLNQAIANNSGSLGFGQGGIDVLGMSPDQVNQLIQNRGVIDKQNADMVNNAVTLADLVSGNREARPAMLQAAGQIFNAQKQDQMQQSQFQHDVDMVNQHLQANKTLAEYNNNLPPSPTKLAELKSASDIADRHIAAQLQEGAARDAKAIQIAQMQIDAGRFDKKDSVALQELKDRTAARTTLATYLGKKDASKEDAQVAAGIASQYPDLTDGYTYETATNWAGFSPHLVAKPMPTVPVKLKTGQTIQAIPRADGTYYVPSWANQGK